MRESYFMFRRRKKRKKENKGKPEKKLYCTFFFL